MEGAAPTPPAPSRGRGRSRIPDRGRSRNLKGLRRLAAYLAPYRARAAGALLALTLAALAVLSLGVGVRYLIDGGFAAGHPGALNHALEAVVIVILVLAVATFFRSYLVTWLAERVVADLRRDVYAHLVRLPPGFFEVTRTGEVVSRLTTDTSVIQAVIGDQRHPGAAQPAAAAGRRRPPAGDQPAPHRPGVRRRPGGRGAARRHRPARTRPLPERPGPHRRGQRRGRGDAERRPHRPGLRPGGARERALRRRRRGHLRRRGALRDGPRPAGRHRHHAHLRRHRRRAVGGRPGRAGRAPQRRRALLLRLLRRHGGERGGRPERHLRRPAARGRRQRAPVRAARRPVRDHRPALPAAPAEPGPRRRAARGRGLRLSRGPEPADAGRRRPRRPPGRDRGAGRAVGRGQDHRLPAPDPLLRPDPRPHPAGRRALSRPRPARAARATSASCRRSR